MEENNVVKLFHDAYDSGKMDDMKLFDTLRKEFPETYHSLVEFVGFAFGVGIKDVDNCTARVVRVMIDAKEESGDSREWKELAKESLDDLQDELDATRQNLRLSK